MEPEIPQNTGNIGRTCVATGASLHLVGRLGFQINDKQLRRAGLDYWQNLQWRHHASWETWWGEVSDPTRVFLFSTKAERSYFELSFKQGDWLVFGKETQGLPESLIREFGNQSVKIPMMPEQRSLNLANASAASLFEVVRQLGLPNQ